MWIPVQDKRQPVDPVGGLWLAPLSRPRMSKTKRWNSTSRLSPRIRSGRGAGAVSPSTCLGWHIRLNLLKAWKIRPDFLQCSLVEDLLEADDVGMHLLDLTLDPGFFAAY